MKQINNSHDKFFKTVFSKKEAVEEFITKLLPIEISQHIDLKSLVLDNTEYVDEKLKVHCSDIVYNANYTNQGKSQPIKISLLFEHKSYQEQQPHLQLLRYFLNLWEHQLKQKQSLTPVIPIIFYHGKSKWNKQPITEYFDEVDDNLKQFLPIFDYLLLDTSQHANQYFQQLSNLDLQISLLLMKSIFNTGKLLENLADIFVNIDELIATEQGKKTFSTMALYLYQNTELTIEEWSEKMQTVSLQAEKQFVSTYDRAIATGMQKGILQGRQEGMQQGRQEGMREGLFNAKKEIALSMFREGSSDEFIKKVTGLTKKQLQEIKDSIKHN